WTFTLDDTNGTVEALNAGATLTDSFTVYTEDGTAQTIDITINGANDAAVVSGTVSGSVTEASGVSNGTPGTATASATLSDSDVDNAADTFTATNGPSVSISGYGTYQMTTGGTWTYTLDDTNSTVEALNAGGSLADSFVVTTEDGTSQTITVVINGADDAAVLSGGTANLTETNSAGDVSTSGTLTISDVDYSAAFTAQTDASGSYGSFSIDSAGAWAYTAYSAHDEFYPGDVYTDTFDVAALDGTTATVTINITGVNDLPGGGVSISGVALQGEVLTAVTSSLTDAESVGTLSYQWLRNGDVPVGTNSSTYTLTSADINAPIHVVVSYTDGGGTAESVASSDTAPIGAHTTGGARGDTLVGSTGDDILDGGRGADLMIGGAGNDTYVVDTGKDRIVELGGEGIDQVLARASFTLPSDVENLTLTGTAKISGTGNDLDNIIIGNQSGSVLTGGLGADTLTGGIGPDRFVYRTEADSGIAPGTWDVITDFNSAQRDKIDLQAMDANVLIRGNQRFTFIGDADFSAAGQVRFDSSTHMLYGSTDADTAPEFSIELLGVTVLTARDILL
ncbi:MAG: hypothetical protein JWQ07_415, partial [Ramlibacter sp.]|nr:hypothetical protein [Ramlibacter sp.]